jgi:2-polyprenyl-3-methyl-5-hydroxy-6-metoxy-1,4-benzoquinol methylase
MANIVLPPASYAGDQWLREVMNADIDRRLDALPLAELDALEVSGILHGSRPWRSFRSIQYPDHDICDPMLDLGRQFDVVIAEQVLEHVRDPWQAMRNMARLCTPNGLVVVTTPFLVRRHPAPNDFWRFTEEGLQVLAQDVGLAVEHLQSWGNRQCVAANLFRWVRRRPWNSLKNEPNFPVVVWMLARKSG